jgi:Raf kinase inhibitor-like YbhB/YbcL family protein
MKLTTDAVDARGLLDPRYTCDLDNSSPELRWSDAPDETRSFALIVEDLDAHGGDGPLAHWVVYQIPGALRHLPAGIPPQDSLPNGIRQGVNGLQKLGYAGPCPPVGARPHRYVFRLFALREPVTLEHRATRAQLLEAIRPHVLAETSFEARYTRQLEARAG